MGDIGFWMSVPSAVWVLIAGVCALACGAAIGEAAYEIAQRRALAASMLAPTRRDQIILRLQGGVKPLRAMATYVLDRIPYIDDSFESAVLLLDEHGLSFTKESLLSLLMALSLVAFVMGLVLAHSLVFGIAAACIVFIGVIAYVRHKSDKLNSAMREQVPEALRSLSMSFRSGHSLSQTISDSAQETDGYLGHLFAIVSDRLEMGATPSEALSVLRSNPRVPELSFVAVALDVQHKSGGSLAPVLESATESVEGELKLLRSLRVQTAQAKLSASIVTIMPFILVALFSLMSPGFLSPFFASPLGMGLLALALVMQMSGVLIVRKMLRVDLR